MLKPAEVDPAARVPASRVQAVRDAAHPITGTASDMHPVLDVIGNATYVLIGEASHGAHDRSIAPRGFHRINIAQVTEDGIARPEEAEQIHAIPAGIYKLKATGQTPTVSTTLYADRASMPALRTRS